MAIVGGYTLDLYCDYPDDNMSSTQRYYHRQEWTFTHDESGAKARAAARRAGWKLYIDEGRALCPMCVKAGRILPPLQSLDGLPEP